MAFTFPAAELVPPVYDTLSGLAAEGLGEGIKSLYGMFRRRKGYKRKRGYTRSFKRQRRRFTRSRSRSRSRGPKFGGRLVGRRGVSRVKFRSRHVGHRWGFRRARNRTLTRSIVRFRANPPKNALERRITRWHTWCDALVPADTAYTYWRDLHSSANVLLDRPVAGARDLVPERVCPLKEDHRETANVLSTQLYRGKNYFEHGTLCRVRIFPSVQNCNTMPAAQRLGPTRAAKLRFIVLQLFPQSLAVSQEMNSANVNDIFRAFFTAGTANVTRDFFKMEGIMCPKMSVKDTQYEDPYWQVGGSTSRPAYTYKVVCDKIWLQRQPNHDDGTTTHFTFNLPARVVTPLYPSEDVSVWDWDSANKNNGCLKNSRFVCALFQTGGVSDATNDLHHNPYGTDETVGTRLSDDDGETSLQGRWMFRIDASTYWSDPN